MSQISDFRNPWRNLLLSQPASFRSIIFHVESGARASGRRSVSFEYPKRNLGYVEDMGRHVRRFQFNGYLVYIPLSNNTPENSIRYDYVAQRTRLYEALEADGPGNLVHPVFCRNGMKVMCERFVMTESRDRGGFTSFDMSFVEAGEPTNSAGVENLVSTVLSNSSNVNQAALDLLAGKIPV